MDCCHGSSTGSLKHLAEWANDILVDKISVEVLSSNGDDTGLANERAQALQRGQVNGLQFTLAEELDKDRHDCSLEKWIDASCLGKENLTQLWYHMKQLFD